MESQNLATCIKCGGQNSPDNMLRYNLLDENENAKEAACICEFCRLDPDQPIPFRPAETTVDQRLALFCEPDEGLAQIVAANSGKTGDKVFAAAAAAELERRNDLKKALAQLNQNGRMLGPRGAD